jgi:hypothetical protein
MPEAIFTTLSLDNLVQQPELRIRPQSSDLGYLASVGAIAVVIIGIFFGIGFSVLAPWQIIGGSGTGNRGTEIKQSSVSAASEAIISTAAGAVSSTGASAVGSMANETTLARPATVSPPQRASGFSTATTAMPPASPPMAAEIADLLARGDSFVVIGDIASARVFYERAASAGDGRAALRMGTTFDPAFLRRAGLPGTFGDPAQARSWYRRAFDLDDEVKRRRNAGDPR